MEERIKLMAEVSMPMNETKENDHEADSKRTGRSARREFDWRLLFAACCPTSLASSGRRPCLATSTRQCIAREFAPLDQDRVRLGHPEVRLLSAEWRSATEKMDFVEV